MTLFIFPLYVVMVILVIVVMNAACDIQEVRDKIELEETLRYLGLDNEARREYQLRNGHGPR